MFKHRPFLTSAKLRTMADFSFLRMFRSLGASSSNAYSAQITTLGVGLGRSDYLVIPPLGEGSMMVRSFRDGFADLGCACLLIPEDVTSTNQLTKRLLATGSSSPSQESTGSP